MIQASQKRGGHSTQKSKSKRTKCRPNFVGTKCKKFANWVYYYKLIGMLHLDIVSKRDAGYIVGYQITLAGQHFTGESVQELRESLLKIKKLLGLQKFTAKSKEAVVIYVDKLDKIRGFFASDITEDFKKTVELFGHVEFREWTDWIDSEDVLDMQKIVDEYFIPEKYFYITPNQRTRKLLKKDCDDDIYNIVYPRDFKDYQAVRKALFGGICYVKNPGLLVDHPMLCLDIKSAYIFSFLVEKHCVSAAKRINPDQWEYFLDSPYESSHGLYTIKYSTASTIISCYKDCNGESLPKGEHEVQIWLNSVDLGIIMNLPKVHVHDVKCHVLESYVMANIPIYVQKRLITEYIKKSKIDKNLTPVLYALQKVVVNGIYGSSIQKCEDKETFMSQRNTAAMAPQWGIWTTSYTKKLLLGLATKLQGWYYSDTDSIYCLDTPENRKILVEYNVMIQKRVKEFCDIHGYDFEALKELGSFEIEHEIVKFKALKQKEYLFTTKDTIDEKGEIVPGEVIVKAAGCNKQQMPKDDSLYELERLPVGDKLFPRINPKKTRAIINGTEYVSDGSYYEKLSHEAEAKMEMWEWAVFDSMNDMW